MKKLISFFSALSLIISICLLTSLQTFAAPILVAILAPDKTTWANGLQALNKEVKEKTNGAVEFKFFFGGVKGDESVVLRKIYSKQLQGGIFTGYTLGQVNGDVRLLEVPFTFTHNRDLAFKVLDHMKDHFNKGFEKKNFKNLGFFEIGSVYLVSTKKAESFDQLKGIKIWIWQGDALASAIMESMSLVSVPLALPDVLPSLSTGIIEAAYAPPLAMLSVQWQTKTKFLIDYPITFSIGAFLISGEAWKKVPDQYKKIVEEICAKHVKEINTKTVKENGEALSSMKLAGLTFSKFPDSDIAKAEGIRKNVIEKLTGKLFTKESLDLFNKTMASLKK